MHGHCHAKLPRKTFQGVTISWSDVGKTFESHFVANWLHVRTVASWSRCSMLCKRRCNLKDVADICLGALSLPLIRKFINMALYDPGLGPLEPAHDPYPDPQRDPKARCPPYGKSYKVYVGGILVLLDPSRGLGIYPSEKRV